MTETKHHVFVYGTLKGMNRRFRSAKLLGAGRTADKHLLFDGGFPLMITAHDEEADQFGLSALGHVRGELYEVDEDTLAHLDSYEGFPDFYTRSLFQVQLEGSIEIKAWIYHGAGAKSSIDRRAIITPSATEDVEWNYR